MKLQTVIDSLLAYAQIERMIVLTTFFALILFMVVLIKQYRKRSQRWQNRKQQKADSHEMQDLLIH